MRKAFTLLEVTVVIVILGILAATVVPRFAGASDTARGTATESALAAARSAIATFRARAVIQGSPAYPTLAELTQPATVLQQGIPRNPYNNLNTVQIVTLAQAQARAVSAEASFAWNYYFDNTADPPISIFYANTSKITTVPDGAGGYAYANQL